MLSAVAGTGAVGIAGCMGFGEGEDEEDTVDFGEGDIQLDVATSGDSVERETVEQILESYANDRSEVGVSYLHIPENYDDRIQTQIGADEEPDVFFVGGEYAPSYDDAGALMDLEDRLSDELMDDLNWDVVDALLTDGMPYIPKDFQTLGVMYNESMFAEAGYEEFPETWSELRDALESIDENADVDYPYVEWGDDLFAGNLWWPWVFANGGQIMNEDNTECVIASEENVEVWEFLAELREDELMGLDSEVSAETEDGRLGEGQAAMVTGGGWVLAELKSNYPDFESEVSVAPPPRPDGEEYGNLIFGGGYGISANTDYPEESVDLVEYLMGDGMKTWLEAGVALSIRESHVDEVELYQEDERYDVFFEMADHPRLGSFVFGPETLEIHNEIYPQIEGLLRGEVSAREGLEAIEQNVNNNVL